MVQFSAGPVSMSRNRPSIQSLSVAFSHGAACPVAGLGVQSASAGSTPGGTAAGRGGGATGGAATGERSASAATNDIKTPNRERKTGRKRRRGARFAQFVRYRLPLQPVSRRRGVILVAVNRLRKYDVR